MKKQIIALITAMTAALSAAPFTALAENPSVSTFDNLSAASAVSATSDIDFVRVSAGGFHSLALQLFTYYYDKRASDHASPIICIPSFKSVSDTPPYPKANIVDELSCSKL